MAFSRLIILVSISSSVFFSFCLPSVSAVQFTKENLYQMGVLATRDGAYDQAVDFFTKAIELDPRFAAAYNGLGIIYESGPLLDLKESVRYFKMAVDIDPDNIDSLNNLGRAHYSSGDFIRAEKYLVQSLALKPGQSDVEISLAWVYLLGQSRAAEALSYFEKNASAENNPMLYYGIGLSYLVLNERFKVMDAITLLRQENREDLALRLEAMLKENVKLASRPGTPLVTGTGEEPSVFSEQLLSMGEERADADRHSDGIQVRLRGPLKY